MARSACVFSSLSPSLSLSHSSFAKTTVLHTRVLGSHLMCAQMVVVRTRARRRKKSLLNLILAFSHLQTAKYKQTTTECEPREEAECAFEKQKRYKLYRKS